MRCVGAITILGLALALPAPLSAKRADPRPGRFAGHARGHDDVVLRVSHGRVRGIRFQARVTCADGNNPPAAGDYRIDVHPRISHTGRFGTRRFKGRFTSRSRAKGTLRISYRTDGSGGRAATTCDSGTVHWRASWRSR